ANCPAVRETLRESRALADGVFHPRKQSVEVFLEQMLQKACRDGHLKVLITFLCPTARELPNEIGVRVDVFTNSNQRLPARIQCAVWCGGTRKDRFRGLDCGEYAHADCDGLTRCVLLRGPVDRAR